MLLTFCLMVSIPARPAQAEEVEQPGVGQDVLVEARAVELKLMRTFGSMCGENPLWQARSPVHASEANACCR